MKNDKFLKLKGANMDINLTADPKKIHWKQDECPWNKEEGTRKHKCAVKNISICDYFKGIEPLDKVICAYKVKG
ncbi:hypothetical protein KJ853_02495 [Patescibacteria group bacterium]|nr:hypothetical protein [Patescibacteria group bacterium]